jgi:hypothetical protein
MSNTLVTPSAKSHERITGRWTRDNEVITSKERGIYYLKQLVGTPVPYLLWAYAALAFFTRAGIEIAAWGCALLTLLYILVDRFSRNREFSFFSVGADFFLVGYFIVGVVGAFDTTSTLAGLATLGGVRWVLLMYLLAYCLELFPGLNRLYFVMLTSAVAASIYGIWQHFTGVDLIRGSELAPGPVASLVYFTSTGFFSTPEVFGTVIAMMIPFPAATYLLSESRDSRWKDFLALVLLILFSVTLLWTYRPGLWMAAGLSIFVIGLFAAKNLFKLFIWMTIAMTATLFITYGDPGAMWSSVEATDIVRGQNQRAQINTQVALWQENIWIGVGHRARDAANYDPGTGNVYFQVLAQSGVLGAGFYFLFLLGFLLLTYRVFHEIPRTHYWHRVFIGGALGSQIAFHLAGLYWSTLAEAVALNLFILIAASVGYLVEHYNRGLVPDDRAL